MNTGGGGTYVYSTGGGTYAVSSCYPSISLASFFFFWYSEITELLTLVSSSKLAPFPAPMVSGTSVVTKFVYFCTSGCPGSKGLL